MGPLLVVHGPLQSTRKVSVGSACVGLSKLDAQKYASARKSCMVTTLNGSIAVEHMLQACDSAQGSSCPRCLGPRNNKIGALSHWLHRSAWPVESRHEARSRRNDESLAESHALSTHSTTMDQLRVVIVQIFVQSHFLCIKPGQRQAAAHRSDRYFTGALQEAMGDPTTDP